MSAPRRVAPVRRRQLEPEAHRSNAAIPVAIVVVGIGLYLGTYTILITALVGLILLFSAGSLLSTRLNPLSAGYYLTRKPSFLAIGTVFLGALVLFGAAYELWLQHAGPIFPHF